MKKIVLGLAILISVSVHAQQLTAYRYWFDNGFASATTVNAIPATNLSIDEMIAVNSLSNGLHSFYIHFKDNTNKWSAVSSSHFFKARIPTPGTSKYQYWFDRGFGTAVTTNITSASNHEIIQSINVNALSDGLHLFNIRFNPDGTDWGQVNSTLFYKIPVIAAGVAKYQYWFDNRPQDSVTVAITPTNDFNLITNIPASTLSNGLHTFHIRFKPNGKEWSSVSSSSFYKAPVNITGISKYQYWFNRSAQDSVTVNISPVSDFNLVSDINTNSLPAGLHSFHIRFKPDGKEWSVIESDFFYKSPFNIVSNNSIQVVRYWFNDESENKVDVVVPDFNGEIERLIDVKPVLPGRHQLNYQLRDKRGIWSSVVSDSFTRVPLSTIVSTGCVGTNRTFPSNVTAAAYQWQVDTGTGFYNIANDAVYSGTNTHTLTLTSPPTILNGNNYRVLGINGTDTTFSATFEMRITNTWVGNSNSNWLTASNWSCNIVPDENTDVIINPGTVANPVLTINATVRSVVLNNGADLQVNDGFILTLKRKGAQ